MMHGRASALHQRFSLAEFLNFDFKDPFSTAYNLSRCCCSLSLISPARSPAMDGLSVAASVIAVVDASVKVASLCSQYYKSVKKAKEDIARLQETVENLQTALEDIKKLLEGQYASKLETSQKVKNALNNCFSDLKNLERELEGGISGTHMRFWDTRALKWPFKSKEVDKIIQGLERNEKSISRAMDIDNL